MFCAIIDDFFDGGIVKTDYYVYIHRRADDNLPFYVGKGRLDRAWKFYERNKYWNNTKEKHGVVVEIVFENLTEDEAFQCEIDTILEFKYFGYPLTNLTHGGDGVSGYKRTPEQIENAKQARRNSEKWYAGHKSASEKLRGRKLSNEHRLAISKGGKGRKLSEGTKQKLSAAKKNCQKSKEHILSLVEDQRDKNQYTFYCVTGEVYTGTRKEFSDFTGIQPKDINKLFQQKSPRKTTHNWSLSPIEIKAHKKKKLTCPQRRSTNVDVKVYTFYHLMGDTFTGTRTEFSDYSQIELVRISSLFCKNPRQSVYGWPLTRIELPDYTHLKS